MRRLPLARKGLNEAARCLLAGRSAILFSPLSTPSPLGLSTYTHSPIDIAGAALHDHDGPTPLL